VRQQRRALEFPAFAATGEAGARERLALYEGGRPYHLK
jgi:hypothetical protein